MTSEPRTERPPVRTWEVVDLPALDFDPLMDESLRDEPVPRLPYAGDLSFGHGVHHCMGAMLARMERR